MNPSDARVGALLPSAYCWRQLNFNNMQRKLIFLELGVINQEGLTSIVTLALHQEMQGYQGTHEGGRALQMMRFCLLDAPF